MIYLLEKDEKIEIGKVVNNELTEKKCFLLNNTKDILQCLLNYGAIIKGNKIACDDKICLLGNVDYFEVDGTKYLLEKYLNIKQNIFIRSGFLREKITNLNIYQINTIEELLEYEKIVYKEEFTQREIRQFYYDAMGLCENLSPLKIKSGDKFDVYYKASRLFYDLKILAYNKGFYLPVDILENALSKAILEYQIKVLKETIKNYEKVILNKNGVTLSDFTDNKELISLLQDEEIK